MLRATRASNRRPRAAARRPSTRRANDRSEPQAKPHSRRRSILGHVQEVAQVAHEHVGTVTKDPPPPVIESCRESVEVADELPIDRRGTGRSRTLRAGGSGHCRAGAAGGVIGRQGTVGSPWSCRSMSRGSTWSPQCGQVRVGVMCWPQGRWTSWTGGSPSVIHRSPQAISEMSDRVEVTALAR